MKAPIKGFNSAPYPQGHVTQYFGENPELYSRAVCHKDGDKDYCLAGHNGIDIVSPWGTPIYAVEDGLAVKVKDSAEGYGKHVRVINFTEGHEWSYAHLARIDVKENQQIKAGEQIGTMGNTGFVISGSTPYWKANPYAGTHLHLTLREVQDIDKYPKTTYPTGVSAHIPNWRNGFFGAVDWLPLWSQSEDATRPLQLTVISLANTAISLLQKIIKLNTK